MKRTIIPYNPTLKSLAKKLRQDMTYAEVKLWNELKMSQMMGYDFDRQKPVLDYIVDLYCKDLMLAIEIPGATHEADHVAIKDEKRQMEMEKLGIQVLRFSGYDVIRDITNVIRAIENWIFEFEDAHGVFNRVLKKRFPSTKLPGTDKNSPQRLLRGGD